MPLATLPATCALPNTTLVDAMVVHLCKGPKSSPEQKVDQLTTVLDMMPEKKVDTSYLHLDVQQQLHTVVKT